MSASRVKYIKQFFPISTFTIENSLITITTSSPHNLFNGIPVTLTSGKSYDAFTGPATVVNSTTFTVNCSKHIQSIDNYCINGYLSNNTGPQEAQTIARGTAFGAIFQSYVNGTGGASYKIELSLDKEHWIPSATITHSTTDGDTGFLSITAGWAYMRANVTSIGSNTNLVIIIGE